MRRTSSALAMIVPLVFLLGSCTSTTGPCDCDGDVEYALRTTPAGVIEKLVAAYGNRDQDAYLDCLSDDFLFFPNEDDCTGDPNIPLYWNVAVEETIHWNRFVSDEAARSVILTLTQVGPPLPIDGPEPGDTNAWQYSEEVDLRVEIDAGLTYVASGGALLFIEQDPIETGPGGETLWEIAEWDDVASFTDAGRAETTWGRLKHSFHRIGIEEPEYPERTTPDNCLARLVAAYENMNLYAYLDCLAEDFVFHTAEADQNDPNNPLPPDWDKETEREIHENMFGPDTNVARITISHYTETSEFDPGSDPGTADDTWDYEEDVYLMLYIPLPGGDLIYLVTADQRFLFHVDPDQSGQGGEDLWEIVEWWDVDPWDGERREDSTWGSIKALYR